MCYKFLLDKNTKDAVKWKNIIDHGLRFVMDYNEDRWGSVSRNSYTFEEGGMMTKDVLANNIAGVEAEIGASSRIYFQNIGIRVILNCKRLCLSVCLSHHHIQLGQ